MNDSTVTFSSEKQRLRSELNSQIEEFL